MGHAQKPPTWCPITLTTKIQSTTIFPSAAHLVHHDFAKLKLLSMPAMPVPARLCAAGLSRRPRVARSLARPHALLVCSTGQVEAGGAARMSKMGGGKDAPQPPQHPACHPSKKHCKGAGITGDGWLAISWPLCHPPE